MAKTTRPDDPIERLLQERQQFATWLARLDATSDTAPESVRGKVRSDYQARLDSVIEQLKSHSAGLVQQLERSRETRSELETREAQAREIMAEAEVRHAVGEYSDDRWQQIRGEAQKNLVSIREELADVAREISELENVQSLIAAPAVAETPAPPPPPPAAIEPVAPPPTVPEPPVAAAPLPEMVAPPAPPAPAEPASPAPEPRPAAAGPRPPRPREGAPQGRTLWFPSGKEGESGSVDELAFLKSVSEDESVGPSPRRASGGTPRPVEAAAPAPAPPSAPLNITSPGEGGRPSTSGARTLKCGECGTMNRPTEWYCERCGAELADL